MAERILVAGGGGFIGGHLVKYLTSKGHTVVAVDHKPLSAWFQVNEGADNRILNLEERAPCFAAVEGCTSVYNLACNMGGVGFIENNCALCMLSVLINTHLLLAAKHHRVQKYLYTSSACVYPAERRLGAQNEPLKEADAYPAMPENCYGWEKLFSERMCQHFAVDFGLNVRLVRFHNVYGPYGAWQGGRERAPAAIARKVIQAKLTGDHTIEIWGDGEQTRSFMYIDDCLRGLDLLMASEFSQPLNLGRSELVSINELVSMTEEIAGIKLARNYKLTAPQGVRGRNSDNTLIRNVLGWEPEISLRAGMRPTYDWIYREMTA